jgi:hypothetical protein
MTDPLDPLGRIPNTRRHRRRASDPPPDDLVQDGAGRNLPAVVVGQTREDPRQNPREERRRAGPKVDQTTLNAHLIGQDHRRRGLRAGQPALDEARASYLGAEYSGAADRRPRPGLIKKTDI